MVGGMSFSDDATFDQFKGTATLHRLRGAEARGQRRRRARAAAARRGEPGTGKTLLAENLADALGLPLIRWHVKSTTARKDGLYVYDTVQRLYDSRFGDGDVRDIAKYIKLGPLGRGVRRADARACC